VVKLKHTLFVAVLMVTAALPLVRYSAQVPRTLTIGVVSGIGSPTARGVALAVNRLNARGNTFTPDGNAYKLAVVEKDANTPSEVSAAITELRQGGVLAVFGPDADELAVASQTVLLSAGVPVFTAATNPALQTTGAVFRTRASDTRVYAAYAQYLINDLKKNKIAIFQGDSQSSPRVQLFSTSLGQLGKTPSTTVLQVQGGALKDSARVLINSGPDMIVAFGIPDQVAQLLREVRAQGYFGTFGYPDAYEPTFVRALPTDLRVGVVGVTNWTYSVPTLVSAEFVRDYVALFGEVPTGKSAAAYDMAVAVVISAARGGTQPEAVIRGVLGLPRVETLQGRFNAALGGNELTADVYIFETGEFGATLPKAQFNEAGRTLITQAEPPPLPSPTPIPLPTPIPPPTLPIPPTPEGVILQPRTGVINVRGGPGTNYDVIGRLQAAQVVQVIGISPNGEWYVIPFANTRGWVSSGVVTVTGALNSIPIIEPPPSPTPIPATLTPTAQPFPDLVPLSVVLNPPQPRVGQPFIASVVLQNRGTVSSGRFAVAASWKPGDIYSATVLEGGLAAAQTTTVNLNVAGVTGAGTFTVEVVVDLNKEVNEGPTGKSNNNISVTYSILP
jgi:ABC-type branched-subunit amino acid transport system substrate-binding protein/uncharacterized protein YgiM (DUF1202 family)